MSQQIYFALFKQKIFWYSFKNDGDNGEFWTFASLKFQSFMTVFFYESLCLVTERITKFVTITAIFTDL